jgi:hypothetical protein
MKIAILDVLNISKDAVHIYIGLAVFFLAVVLWKKGRIDSACLIPVIAAALSMELLDLYDDWLSLGQPRWAASVHDIINTSLWPAVIVTLVKIRAIK